MEHAPNIQQLSRREIDTELDKELHIKFEFEGRPEDIVQWRAREKREKMNEFSDVDNLSPKAIIYYWKPCYRSLHRENAF